MIFDPLTPRDYPRYKPFFRRQTYPLSIYSLASLIAWKNEIYESRAAVAQDALIIYGEFLDNRKPPHLLMPVCNGRHWTPEALHELALNLGIESYWFVPEDYLLRVGKSPMSDLFDTEEQTAYTDYVYLSEDLATLKGNRYAKKRNLINQFQRIYVNSGRVRTAPIDSASVPECIEFLEAWCRERDCDKDPAEEIACEKKAAIRALIHALEMEMRGLLLRIDGVVSALGLASRLTEEMGVLHFEKAFAAVKGLYQYFDNQCARTLFKGIPFLNKESDMNIPGLAKAKKSYHPNRMIRSYQLTVK
jgi:hypothetical protein